VNGELLQSLPQDDEVLTLAFSPFGDTLAIGLGDGTIRIWHIANQTLTRSFTEQVEGVTSVAFSPDGTVLAGASNDLRLWRFSDGMLLRKQTDGVSYNSRLVFSSNGGVLATIADDKVQIYQMANNQLLLTLRNYEDDLTSIAISPNDQKLAVGNDNHTILIWNVADGRLLQLIEGHMLSVTGVAFSPDGMRLISSSLDGTIRVWQVV
jgi:WD40 repeat protein